MSKSVIVIDFDDTLTAMPAFWREIITLAKTKYDQRVICMTQRTQDESNITEVDEWMADNQISLPVYYTNGMSKTLELERLGIEKYILCDDNPRRAVNGV
jgi:hypothetical protein